MRVLVTHTDLDGLGSAIISIVNGLFDRIYCWNHDKFTFELNPTDENVVADLSVEDHVYDLATVFDHHDPSLGKVKRGVCDINRCGTRIFYEEYVPKEMHTEQFDRFVSVIDAYDRWQEAHPDFNEGLDFTRLLGEVAPQRYDMLIYDGHLLDTPYKRFIELVISNDYSMTASCSEIVQRVIEKENREYMMATKEMKTRTDRKGLRFGITYIDDYASQVANRILKENRSMKYLLILNHRHTNKLSARSKSIDLNSLKGVRGHRKAAGGLFNPRMLQELYSGRIQSIEYE